MEQLVIVGGTPLEGSVRISGAKNGALPLLAATLLTEEPLILGNVPELTDVEILLEILRELGVTVERRGPNVYSLTAADESRSLARYELVSKMRASIYVLGPMLAKRGYAKVSLPGGCVIGLRPVDLHIRGMKALGAEIELDHGYVVARAPGGRLRGGHMFLAGPAGSSVGATANVLMAATLAEGTTVIDGAAAEPEVLELANLLNAMGARITGAGTGRIEIEGVEELHGARTNVIPDRIEAGTYAMMAAAVPGSDVILEEARLDHLGSFVEAIRAAGVSIEQTAPDLVRVRREERLQAVNVTTLPYPGYPTDLQAQLVALLACAEGTSVVTERIYPDRFLHTAELDRMGARIQKEGASAVIHGVARLKGAEVGATDLRAGAALVLAGLAAKGVTRVHEVQHVDRGYSNIEDKLGALGAHIHREMVSSSHKRAA
ncbi:MAG: UDP-N-acetylglucosamine 1-carboxyvinyltransferase [Planctomycetota bacterium]